MSQKQGTDTPPNTAGDPPVENFTAGSTESNPADGITGFDSPNTDAPLPEEMLNLVPQPRPQTNALGSTVQQEHTAYYPIERIEDTVQTAVKYQEVFGKENFSLQELDAASDSQAAQLRPANTARGYASDWKVWQEFTAAHKVPSPATWPCPTAPTRSPARSAPGRHGSRRRSRL